MKKRILSLILALVMVLGMLPVTASAAEVTALPEPGNAEYRFNGHAVTDRSAFSRNLEGWTLATFTDTPAIITAGAASGVGVTFSKVLKESWQAQITISMASDDCAGLLVGNGNDSINLLLTTVSGAATFTASSDSTVFTEQALGNYSEVTMIIDNCYDGEALRVLFYSGESYLGGWQISVSSSVLRSMLKAVDTIRFYAQTAGDSFSDFGVNNMIYAYQDDPAAALALVEKWAKQEVEGSIVEADNGVLMYTPDGVKNYDALWTRDFNYMLEYAGDYIPVENAVACIEYLLENVHEGDCWLPDRVYGNGKVNYAAGDMVYERRNLDNNSFIVIALDCALDRMSEAEGKALFEKWESTIMTALDSLPKDENGLIYNDPLNPHSPYGFTDCICKTGSLMKESLLLWRAYSIMEKRQRAYGHNYSVAAAGADRIEAVLIDTFENEDGMLNAATVDCCQSDIWGSCYAISIGFPMEESLKKSIADYLAENYTGLVQMGQVRHTAPGTYWGRLLSGVNEGEYQNGAYWATPTGWFIDALEPYYPELAMITMQDIISYFEADGIYECINGDHKKLNHYAASASNILPAARRLLTEAPELQSIRILGDSAAVKGATKEYSFELQPVDSKLASCTWTLNGTVVSNAKSFSYIFSESGSYTLVCDVTDINGVSCTAQINITVSEPDYPAITLRSPAVSGKSGETVSLAYEISAGSALVSADWSFAFDPAKAEFLGCEAGNSFDGVLSAKAEGGEVKLCMATAEPVIESGALVVLKFRLLADSASFSTEPQLTGGKCNYMDDTGLHDAEIDILGVEGPVEAVDLVFRNKTLSLQSYIAFNITARNSVLQNYDSWYVVFERYDHLSGAVVTETVASVPYSTSYQLFEYKVSSYMMSDSITATLYAVKDGVTYKGEVYTDSVENFVISRMASAADSSADLATLYANLLTYGSKAQTFLGYNTAALADANLGEYASYVTTAAPTAENLYAETSNGLTGATKNKLALGISSAVQIQLRINLDANYDVNTVYGELSYTRGSETITQRIDGKDFTKSGSRYVLIFDAITAVDGRAPVAITIYDASGNAISETWTYSISSYLVDGGLSGNGLATMEALLNYFDAAAKVFG